MPMKLTSEEARAKVELAKLSPRHGKHGKHKKTLIKERVAEQVEQRLLERSMRLIDAQTILGVGAIRIYKIVTETIGNKKVKQRPVLVTSDWEIEAVLGYEYGDEESPNTDEEYYFVEIKEPNNQALDSQLDRSLGKVVNKTDHTTNGKELTFPVVGMQIIKD